MIGRCVPICVRAAACRVEAYRRTRSGWALAVYVRLNDSVALRRLRSSLPRRAIYRDALPAA